MLNVHNKTSLNAPFGTFEALKPQKMLYTMTSGPKGTGMSLLKGCQQKKREILENTPNARARVWVGGP